MPEARTYRVFVGTDMKDLLKSIPSLTDGYESKRTMTAVELAKRTGWSMRGGNNSIGIKSSDHCMGLWRLELVEQGISEAAYKAAVAYMVANDIRQDKEVLHTIAKEFQEGIE